MKYNLINPIIDNGAADFFCGADADTAILSSDQHEEGQHVRLQHGAVGVAVTGGLPTHQAPQQRHRGARPRKVQSGLIH